MSANASDRQYHLIDVWRAFRAKPSDNFLSNHSRGAITPVSVRRKEACDRADGHVGKNVGECRSVIRGDSVH
ncbi:hypothetical protein EAH79_01740 [Sphingomonas koreensis]|nr:hypothetical protein EAH79_01740 [Sphingomonas koreensis]